jgi:hypothetical protein
LQQAINLVFEPRHPTFENLDQASDLAAENLRSDGNTILFCDDQGHQLTAACHEIGQQPLLPLANRGGRQVDHGAKVGEKTSVDGVGLGQLADALSEATDTPGVHERCRKPRLRQASSSGRS